jgi:hypothetical protein
MEDFLRFLTVICTAQYNKQFMSYDFLKSTGWLKFCSGQNRVSREIWTFHSKSNAISGNFQNQRRSLLSQIYDGYSSTTIGLMIQESWSLKVGSAAGIPFWTEQDTWTHLEFEPTLNGKQEEP